MAISKNKKVDDYFSNNFPLQPPIDVDVFDRSESMSNACFTTQQLFFYSNTTISNGAILFSHVMSLATPIYTS